jgi:hypothetical protein
MRDLRFLELVDVICTKSRAALEKINKADICQEGPDVFTTVSSKEDANVMSISCGASVNGRTGELGRLKPC